MLHTDLFHYSRNYSLKKKIQWPKQLLWCSHQQTTGKHTSLPWIFFLLLLMQLHWRSSVFALHNLITEIKKTFPSAVGGGKDIISASSSSCAFAPLCSADKAQWERRRGEEGTVLGSTGCTHQTERSAFQDCPLIFQEVQLRQGAQYFSSSLAPVMNVCSSS